MSIKKVICKYCDAITEKIFCGKVGYRKQFKDSSGRKWQGARCPECQSKRNAENYKKRSI